MLVEDSKMLGGFRFRGFGGGSLSYCPIFEDFSNFAKTVWCAENNSCPRLLMITHKCKDALYNVTKPNGDN